MFQLLRLLLISFSSLLLVPLTASAMTVSAASDVAVVGCGVLGTSLCKQLLESADFASAKGRV